MKLDFRHSLPKAAALAMVVAHATAAQSASPEPSFEVGYRAWEVVTELARSNADPAISGECGRTFRPFVIPGLRRQTRQEEQLAAAACQDAARSACANTKLRKPAETVKKCEEFR